MEKKIRVDVVSSVNIDLFGGTVTVKTCKKAPAPSPDTPVEERRLRGVAKELRGRVAAKAIDLQDLRAFQAFQTFLPFWDKIREDSYGAVRSMLHQHQLEGNVAVGQAVPPVVIDESFTAPIAGQCKSSSVEEPMDAPGEVLNATKKPLPVRDNEAIRAIQENTAAVKENTAARENDVFKGTFRARARFSEPDDEVEIEKIIRLKHDGWNWGNIVKQVYPDSDGMSKEDFNKLVDATKKLHQRECEQSESRKPGEGWASMQ
jgi:hypothetical protein